MKKRILSMLLLVAMLVTGIPVMAVTASEGEAATKTYAEMYAKQENLVHLYTAFDKEAAASDIEAGKWTDLVGDLDATIKHDTKISAKWTVGEKGGLTLSSPNKCVTDNELTFSVDAFKDASGNWYDAYTVDATVKTVNRQVAPTAKKTWAEFTVTETAGGTNYLGAADNYTVITASGDAVKTTLTFAVAEAPAEDKTVTVTYVNYGAKKTNGNAVAGKTATTATVDVTVKAGETTATAVVLIQNHQSVDVTVPADSGLTLISASRVMYDAEVKAQVKTAYAFGHMFVLRWPNALGYDVRGAANTQEGFGYARWSSGATVSATYNSGTTAFVTPSSFCGDFRGANDGSAISMTVIKTKGEHAEYGTVDHFTVYHGNVTVMNNVAAKGLSGTAVYGTATDAPSPKFQMMISEQGTVYAVRVYNVALAKADADWNHFVDILAYNNYDLSLLDGVSQTILDGIAENYADVSIEEADLSDLADIIERLSATSATDYASLYVGADGEKTANGASLLGLFTAFKNETVDIASGKWANKMDGTGATDAVLVDTADTVDWAVTSNGGLSLGITSHDIYLAAKNKTGIELNGDWLAAANFTVESVAVAYGIVGDNNQAYWDGPNVYGGINQGINNFRIDLVHGEYTKGLATVGGIRMNVLWRSDLCGTNHCAGGAHSGRSTGFTTAAGITGESTDAGNANYAPGGTTFGLTKIYDAAAKTYTYGQYYSNGGGKVCMNGTVYTEEAYNEAVKAFDTVTRFKMYNATAMDAYAIRVYDGLLTEAEKQYNHLIDLLAFYQVEVPEEVDAAALSTLASAYYATTLSLENDPEKGGADYSAVRKSLSESMEAVAMLASPAALTAYDELYAAQDDLVALYSAFSADDDSVLIAYSTWKNKVAGGAAATLYDTHDTIDFAAGEKGGINISGATQSNYGVNTPKYFGIKLSDSYAEMDAFTVENVAILTGIAYTKTVEGETVADTADKAGDFQNFRFGALSCDHWINLNGKIYFHRNWRNIPVSESHAYHRGQRDTKLREAVDAAGKIPVGLTQTVTMATETDGSKTYGVYHNSAVTQLGSNLAQNNISKEQYEATVAAEQKKLGSFYLFAGTPGDVYAIRVYDKVLNAEEMAQNHFVDLLAFYGIAIPDGLTADTFAPFAAVAEELVNTPFYADATKAAETKATIEASIEAVDKLVLLDDTTEEKITTLYPVDGEVTLPVIIDGRTVIAYSDMEMRYAFPGEKIAVEGTAYYYAIGTAEPIISTDEKVDMKLYEETVGEGDEATTETKLGIRFNATVNFAALQEKLGLMNEFIDDESLKIAIKNYGILVAPKAYVEAAGAFTVEALDAYAEANGSDAGTYVAISSREWYDVDEPSAYKLVGGLVDFSAASIENNVEYAAIAFIELDVDEDPYSDTIVYGAYNADACITLKAAAEKALDGMSVTAPEYAALTELLAQISEAFEE